MRGFLWIKVGDQVYHKPNFLSTYEANRAFRQVVGGTAASPSNLYGDLFFIGDHGYDTASGTFPAVFNYSPNGELNSTMATLASTSEVMRFRRRQTDTNLAPAQPSQIAYAQGQIGAQVTNPVPDGMISSADISLFRIGSVFGHPSGRRAFFNETAIAPTGVGRVFASGVLDFATGSGWSGHPSSGSNRGEEGHYIYYIRMGKTGNLVGTEADARYIFQRRPYFYGAFEPGAGSADGFAGVGTLADRLSTAPAAGNANRGLVNMSTIFPDQTAPTPSQIPYQIGYPTLNGDNNGLDSICAGLVFDGLPAVSASVDLHPRRSGHIWWAVVDPLASNNANASTSRSLWSWKRFTSESPKRRDAADNLGRSEALANFPSLGTTVQFRDLKAGRLGYIYLAADGNDDANTTGNKNGGLIMIDTHSASITMVAGIASGGIYHSGGLNESNVVGIAVDKSGRHTASSSMDRVWTLHRNGLSYIDIDVERGGVSSGSIKRIGSGTSDFNVIHGDSIRGLGGFTPRAAFASRQNNHGKLIDVDGQGNVYWVSCETGKNYSNSLHRLNRLHYAGPDTFRHSFYVLHTTAGALTGSAALQTGSMGIIHMGLTTATSGLSGTINSLIVHCRDPGDPDSDDIWLSTGQGDNSTFSVNVRQIPTSSWLKEDNPGIAYHGSMMSLLATDASTALHVAPDGTIWHLSPHSTSNTDSVNLLESFGRVVSGSGAGANISEPVLIDGRWVQTITSSQNRFTPSMMGKRILVTNTTVGTNSGSFVTTGSFLSPNHIRYINSGASETSSFSWIFQGVEFDSTGTVGGAPGSWASGNSTTRDSWGYNWFADDSGIGYIFSPRATTVVGPHCLLMTTALTWQWDPTGSQWYRSRVPTIEAANTKRIHSATNDLVNGVATAFSATNAGGSEFVKDEFYTFPVSIGIIKDAAQEVTWGYDLFYQKADLFERPASASLASKLCTMPTLRGGFINTAALTTVTSSNPFVLSTSASQDIVMYQRRLTLNGSNNTQLVTISGAPSTTSGFQIGIDFGSDVVASKLGWAFGNFSNSFGFGPYKIDLYSATSAAGSGSWTQRATFQTDQDHPEWSLALDAFHDNTSGLSIAAQPWEMTADLEALDGSGSFGANSARRYWKVVFSTYGGGTPQAPNSVVGIHALDVTGKPIGISEDNYLSFAHQTDYLANHVIRGVFLQDSGTLNASEGTALNHVTLSAGTFQSGSIAQNDFFRVLSGSTITQEHRVRLVKPSSTELVLMTPIRYGFVSSSWEIVRDADVRTGGADGGTAQFPPSGGAGAGQVFICPVTGHIRYNDSDISNARRFRIERVIKLKREI